MGISQSSSNGSTSAPEGKVNSRVVDEKATSANSRIVDEEATKTMLSGMKAALGALDSTQLLSKIIIANSKVVNVRIIRVKR